MEGKERDEALETREKIGQRVRLPSSKRASQGQDERGKGGARAGEEEEEEVEEGGREGRRNEWTNRIDWIKLLKMISL